MSQEEAWSGNFNARIAQEEAWTGNLNSRLANVENGGASGIWIGGIYDGEDDYYPIVCAKYSDPYGIIHYSAWYARRWNVDAVCWHTW